MKPKIYIVIFNWHRVLCACWTPVTESNSSHWTIELRNRLYVICYAICEFQHSVSKVIETPNNHRMSFGRWNDIRIHTPDESCIPSQNSRTSSRNYERQSPMKYLSLLKEGTLCLAENLTKCIAPQKKASIVKKANYREACTCVFNK